MRYCCPYNDTLCLKDYSSFKDVIHNEVLIGNTSVVITPVSCPYNNTLCLKNSISISPGFKLGNKLGYI